MAAIKALTSGNPLLLEHAEVQADVATLRRLQTAHGRDQSHRQHQVVQKTNLIERYTTEVIPRLEAAVAVRVDTSGNKFTAMIDGRSFDGRSFGDRTDAAAALRAQINHGAYRLDKYARPTMLMEQVAQVGGHTIDAVARIGHLGQEATVDLIVQAAPERMTTVSAATLREDGIGVIIRVENLINGLDKSLASAKDTVEVARGELAEARSGLGQPFPKTRN